MSKFTEIGISNYYYDFKPSGGRLRESPEDFFVEEKFPELERKETGNVLILKLKARNWEHNRLIRYLARSMGVSPKRIYFAGTKDKRSLKVQYFSIPGAKYKDIKLEDVDILDHFYLERPLVTGSHTGNFFRIRVVDCDLDTFRENCGRIASVKKIPNFYGPQRFGALRPVTHLVGRELVKGNYSEATRLFIGFPGNDRFAKERKKYYDDPDPKSHLREFPQALDLEIKVLKHLVEHPDDNVGAIKELPDNLVQMFIHAYQGYLFNMILNKRMSVEKGLMAGDIFHLNEDYMKVTELNMSRLKKSFEEGKGAPTGLVIGYGSEYASGLMGKIEREVVTEEGIEESNFKIPFGLKSKGERRDLFFSVPDLVCGDGSVEFTLGPGSYATSLIREITREEKMENY